MQHGKADHRFSKPCQKSFETEKTKIISKKKKKKEIDND